MSSSQLYKDAYPPTIPGDSSMTDAEVTRNIKLAPTMSKVTQATSVTTAVTANSPNVQITTFADATVAGAVNTFTLNNSFIGVDSNVQATVSGIAGSDSIDAAMFPTVTLSGKAAGSVVVNVANLGSGAAAADNQFVIDVMVVQGGASNFT